MQKVTTMREMQSRDRKRTGSAAIGFILALVMLAMPFTAFAAQTNDEIDGRIATKDALHQIVNTQVDGVYSAVKSSVETYINKSVSDILGNKAAIKAFAQPLVSEAIKNGLKTGYAIDNPELNKAIDGTVTLLLNSATADRILDNQCVQAVIARTSGYVAAEVAKRLNIDADKARLAAEASDHLWNAPRSPVGTATTLVKADIPVYATLGAVFNTSYYNFDVLSWNTQVILFVPVNTTPREIQITGWNQGNILTYIASTLGADASAKTDAYLQAIGAMNYREIVSVQMKKAVRDEINARVSAYILEAKTKICTELEKSLAGQGIRVTLNPADSFEKIGQDINTAKLNHVKNVVTSIFSLFKR